MINTKTYKLGDICENISYGYTESATLENVGPKFLRITDIQDDFVNWDNVPYCPITEQNHKKYKLEIGDIVIARTGASTGTTAIFKDKNIDAVFASYLIRYKINKKLANPFYIGQILKSSLWKSYVNSIIGGSAQPGANAKQFAAFEFPLPDLNTQLDFAAVLSAFDEKIELNFQMNQTFESMSQTLFRQWFITNESNDWETVRLGDLIEIKGGFAYKGENIGTGDVLLLGMGCVSFKERFLLSGARPYSGDNFNNYLVRPGDIVIATRQQSDNLPILGFPARVPSSFEEKKVIVGANLYRVINATNFSNSLLFQLLRSNEYRNHILSNSKGSTVRMITKDAIENFKFKMPPTELLQEYSAVLSSLDDKIEVNNVQRQSLSALRDTLLPKLMIGKIPIKN
jgi:type I restriction enzyme S subunit